MRVSFKPNEAWHFGFRGRKTLTCGRMHGRCRGKRAWRLPAIAYRSGTQLCARPLADLGGSVRVALRNSASRGCRCLRLLCGDEVQIYAAALWGVALEPGIFRFRNRSRRPTDRYGRMTSGGSTPLWATASPPIPSSNCNTAWRKGILSPMTSWQLCRPIHGPFLTFVSDRGNNCVTIGVVSGRFL